MRNKITATIKLEQGIFHILNTDTREVRTEEFTIPRGTIECYLQPNERVVFVAHIDSDITFSAQADLNTVITEIHNPSNQRITELSPAIKRTITFVKITMLVYDPEVREICERTLVVLKSEAKAHLKQAKANCSVLEIKTEEVKQEIKIPTALLYNICLAEEENNDNQDNSNGSI